jgi:hypothetical protein
MQPDLLVAAAEVPLQQLQRGANVARGRRSSWPQQVAECCKQMAAGPRISRLWFSKLGKDVHSEVYADLQSPS